MRVDGTAGYADQGDGMKTPASKALDWVFGGGNVPVGIVMMVLVIVFLLISAIILPISVHLVNIIMDFWLLKP